MIAVHEGI
jgi:hypothetical protein